MFFYMTWITVGASSVVGLRSKTAIGEKTQVEYAIVKYGKKINKKN